MTRSTPRSFLSVAATLAAICAVISCDRGPPSASPPNSPSASTPRRSTSSPETRPQQRGAGAAPLADGNMVGSPVFDRYTGALSHPTYVSASEAGKFLTEDDAVFVVRAKDATYVYPRVMLSPHHVVNETIDGKPVAVTYCQLSECATLFSREVDGDALTFGWLRSLYNGGLVMSDHESLSRWVQFVGECFQGPKRGRRLTSLGDIDRMNWSVARTLPNPKVLKPVLDLESCRSFVAAIDAERYGLQALRQVAQADDRLPSYDRGLGISVRGEAMFFRLEDIRRHGIIESAVGGWSLLVVSDDASSTARMFRRIVRGRVLSFRRHGDQLSDTETGSLWNIQGECVEGALAGERLGRPLYSQSWWFAWSSFYPRTAYWRAAEPGQESG